MKLKKQWTALLTLFCLNGVLFGDTIRLKNGDVLRGTIVHQGARRVVIRTRYGRMSVAKERIHSVRITPKKKQSERVYLQLHGGKRVDGILLQQTDSYLLLQTAGRKRRIPKSSILQMSWRRLPAQPTGRGHYLPPLERIWRSALVPSWGQFASGQTTRGIIWATACGGLLISTVAFQIDYQAKLNDYRAFGVHNEDLFRTAEDARKRTNLFILFTLSAWLLNVADAWLLGPAVPASHTSAGLRLQSHIDSLGMVRMELTYKF